VTGGPKPTPVPRPKPTPVRREAVTAPAPTPVRVPPERSRRAQSGIPNPARSKGPAAEPKPTPVRVPPADSDRAPGRMRPSARSKGPAAIDPRIKRRRIEVTRHNGRRRLYVVLTALGVVAVLVGLVGATQSPLLDVDHVEVTGALHTPVPEVVAAGGLDTGPQMVDVDPKSVARQVEKLPWVASATATREWPATVKIAVVERKDVASTPAADGKWAVADADGHVLAIVDGRPNTMPSVAGAPLAKAAGVPLEPAGRMAMHVAAALPDELRSKTVELRVGADGGVDLALLEGAVVRLGEAPAQLSEKLDAAITVLRTLELRRIAVLDVRVPRAPVLTRR
jgi:cell division protein FtsQ